MDRSLIDLIKSRLSLSSIISQKVKLTKNGNNYICLCPFHSEKTPSFRIDDSKGLYHCFGCGRSGDHLSFIIEYEKLNFAQAIEKLSTIANITIPKHSTLNANFPIHKAINFAKEWFIDQYKKYDKPKIYLKERNIRFDICEKFQLGFCPNNDELYKTMLANGFSPEILLQTGIFIKSSRQQSIKNRYEGRLIFPILNKSENCIGFGGRSLNKDQHPKYINSPETELFIKSDNLYAINHAMKNCNTNQLIIVEGYIDAISMHMIGMSTAVASMGTAISQNQIKMCWQYCDEPIILLDGDQAGYNASKRWIDKILPILQPKKSAKFAFLPKGTDPDSIIYKGEHLILKDAVNGALSLVQWLWDSEFSSNSCSTPEQIAYILSSIKKKITTIEDKDIKNCYKNQIYKMQRDFFSIKQDHKKNTHTFQYSKLISPIPDKSSHLPKILLALITFHPHILDIHLEQFSIIKFDDDKLNKLKEEMLDWYTQNGLEFHEFKKNNLEIIDELQTNATIFLGFSLNNPKEAVLLWEELFETYCVSKDISNDLFKASINMKETFSKNDWLRLKALKNSSLAKSVKNIDDEKME